MFLTLVIGRNEDKAESSIYLSFYITGVKIYFAVSKFLIVYLVRIIAIKNQ